MGFEPWSSRRLPWWTFLPWNIYDWYLYLNKTQVADLAPLDQMRAQLRHLDIRDTPLTYGEVDRFRQDEFLGKLRSDHPN